MTPSPRIDWFRVIVDLERARFTHRKIAQVMGVHRLSVLNLKNGAMAEPRFTPAQRLIGLWVATMQRDELPMEGVGKLDRPHVDTAVVPAPGKDYPHAEKSPATAHPRCPAGCSLCLG